MNKRLRLLLLGAVVFGLMIAIPLVGVGSQSNPGNTAENGFIPQDETIVVEQHASYAQVSQKELIKQANFVFEGIVLSISPTRWNQDSGEKWDGGLILHTVEIEVERPIVGDVELNKNLSLVILGASPFDGQADYDFKVGDRGIFFVRKTDLTWNDGFRAVNMLIGVPSSSYLLADNNGEFTGPLFSKPLSLDEVSQFVVEHRTP